MDFGLTLGWQAYVEFAQNVVTPYLESLQPDGFVFSGKNGTAIFGAVRHIGLETPSAIVSSRMDWEQPFSSLEDLKLEEAMRNFLLNPEELRESSTPIGELVKYIGKEEPVLLVIEDVVTFLDFGTYDYLRRFIVSHGARCMGVVVAGDPEFPNCEPGYITDGTWMNRKEAIEAYDLSEEARNILKFLAFRESPQGDPFILEMLEE